MPSILAVALRNLTENAKSCAKNDGHHRPLAVEYGKLTMLD